MYRHFYECEEEPHMHCGFVLRHRLDQRKGSKDKGKYDMTYQWLLCEGSSS